MKAWKWSIIIINIQIYIESSDIYTLKTNLAPLELPFIFHLL